MLDQTIESPGVQRNHLVPSNSKIMSKVMIDTSLK